VELYPAIPERKILNYSQYEMQCSYIEIWRSDEGNLDCIRKDIFQMYNWEGY
jgi:hypothetical protein